MAHKGTQERQMLKETRENIELVIEKTFFLTLIWPQLYLPELQPASAVSFLNIEGTR